MGVIKVSEQANITATKKGRSLTSIIDDKLITIGVNNAAVALLEIRLVDINVIRYNRLKVICGLYWPNVFCIKSAISWSPPVFSSAVPIDKTPAIIKITFHSTAL